MAVAARVRLRIAGIAAHVDTMDPHNIQPSKSGETRIGLWVIEDDQHEDAVMVLVNPEHVPRRILSLDEISQLEASVEKRARPPRPLGDIVVTLLLAGGLLALVGYTAIEFFVGP